VIKEGAENLDQREKEVRYLKRSDKQPTSQGA
jgi:hypothetical protein